MKIFRSIALLFTLLALSSATTTLSAQGEYVDWSTSVEHLDGDNYRIVFSATIDNGWHMYDLGPYGSDGPTPVSINFESTPGITLEGGLRQVTQTARVYDELFSMEIGSFEGGAVFEQLISLSREGAIVNAEINWMVCDDATCMPPSDLDIRLEVGDISGLEGVNLSPLVVEPNIDAFNQEMIISASAGNGSIWSSVGGAMMWALLALLTPCVFPMIPMTVSFFMKEGSTVSQSRFVAGMYGLFIVLLYTVPIAILILVTRVVGGDAVTADIFNWLSTHWLPNVIFFLVFFIFAASFFGAFEIRMPSKLVNKADSKSDRKGLGGVFFMALTLVLVSFSCTGPLVGNALIQSTSGGSFWAPIATMLAFSTVFAIPFTMFAFFPTLLNKLPKSGGWLNSVKVVLGFIEVALGLKFLSVADQTYHWGILDREIYLAIWIVVFTLMGVYLLGKIKFVHDSDVKHIGVGRLALVIITFSFVVYLVPGMFGAPLKGLSGYLPPMHTQDFVIQQERFGASGGGGGGGIVQDDDDAFRDAKYSDFLHLPHGLRGFFDLDEAQAYADKVGKPLFVSITGHGCVNCREMEARVWANSEVLNILRNDYVLLSLYVDDKTILPEAEWYTTASGKVLKGLGKINARFVLDKYGVNAQPYYVLQGRDGRILAPPRGYDLSVPGFIEFLRGGLDSYNTHK